MATTGHKIDRDGTVKYYSEHNTLHRDDGPAVIYADGEKRWYKNGLCHKEDGPAVEDYDGKLWYQHGKLHREAGPAVESFDGDIEFRRNGVKIPKLEVFVKFGIDCN